MAMRLSPILDSVVYILDTEGNILGYDSIVDYSNERMEKIIQDRIKYANCINFNKIVRIAFYAGKMVLF